VKGLLKSNYEMAVASRGILENKSEKVVIPNDSEIC